ncbi:MAG: signal peptide peptidase SppA [Acidobacteriota bacterium]
MAKRHTGLWLLATFFLFVIIFATFAWTMNRMLGGGTPAIGSGTVLRIDLQGALGEVRAGGPLPAPITVREIDEAIHRAASDDRVAALFLDVGPLSGGFAKVQEIRSAVHLFRQSGKPAVSLLEIGSGLDLYAAVAADTVVQVPTGQLTLGLLLQEVFYRDLFDKLGVQFEVFHSGPYKTAMNSYTERASTPQQREMGESLLESIYRQWLADVASDRQLERDELAAIYDRGILLAPEAKQAGLVDELGYRSRVRERLEEIAGGKVRQLGVRDYLRATGRGLLSKVLGRAPVVAVVYISGVMVPGDVENSFFGANIVAGTTVARYLRQAREDDRVRAIVVRVDSPGGAVTAADVIGREVQLAAEKKPVIISMSDVAASGGYWVASGGSRVFADPATYTGSIGVIMGRINLAGTYEMLGVNYELLKRGANADLFSDAAPLRPEQAKILEESVQTTYGRFIAKVAEGRRLPADKVEALAAGRVWTGEQARANGLIDELGGLREALVEARIEAGIRPGRAVSLRIFPPRRSFFSQLTRFFSVATQLHGATGIDAWKGLELARRLRPGGLLWALADSPLPAAAR